MARIDETRAAVAERDGVAPADVPSDLLTQSGGGLDPHLSRAGANLQAARIARARNLPEADVLALIAANIEAKQFGLLGAERINVLRLNLALDALAR